MSAEPQSWPEPDPVVARAVRAKNYRWQVPLPVAVRDRLGELFPDEEFATAFGRTGPSGWSPGRLALVTVFQMAENLTGRQPAEAVRDRLSWAYALGLKLEDTGFDFTMLSQFRTRVVEHGLEGRVLDLLPTRLKEQGLVGSGGRQRTDSTHVVSAVRDLNRLKLAGKLVRAAVEALTVAAPQWVADVLDVPRWSRRYDTRIETWCMPSSPARRDQLAMLAHAFLTVVCVDEHARQPKPDGLIPLTCNEIQHLFTTLIARPAHDAAYRLAWSAWRCRHQARAQASHYRRQATQT